MALRWPDLRSNHALKPAREVNTPVWLCTLVILWLLVYLPAYAQAYGASHFLQLCNVGLLVTCIALLTRSALLLSMQWLATPIIAVLWLVDVAAFGVLGQPWHGGTMYLWDASIPWLARALSVYHVFVPLLLLQVVRKTGYDRRALVAQLALTLIVMAISVLAATPQNNLNYLYHGPGQILLGGPPWKRALTHLFLAGVLLYLPMHLLSSLLFKPSVYQRKTTPS
jgi:hypothetical protein